MERAATAMPGYPYEVKPGDRVECVVQPISGTGNGPDGKIVLRRGIGLVKYTIRQDDDNSEWELTDVKAIH